MKKILSLVLVLSLVLGSFSMAFAAPADVEGTKYEEAVTRLEALNVLGGYDDGTFKPEKTITRAEFAKIMANVSGVGEAAKYANGQTKFVDVPATHWAAGYINVVSDMGIINGYGDGNFGASDQVTYAQAITMVVRALGFEQKAKSMGGFPGGYLAVAAEEGITKKINVVQTLAATRGDVALMVDNALEVPMMYQASWGQYPEYKNDEPDRTLMKTKLDVEEVKGTVTAVAKVAPKLDANEIKITVTNKDNTTTESKYTVLADFNQNNIFGKSVKAWANTDGDIFFVNVTTDTDNVIVDTIDKYEATLTAATPYKLTTYVSEDTYKIDKDAKIYVNFVEETTLNINTMDPNFYGTIVLDDGDVIFASLFNFEDSGSGTGVVTEVDGDEITVIPAGDSREDDLDLDDYDNVYVLNADLTVADKDDIKEDSAVFYFENKVDDDDLYIVVKNEVVEGKVTRTKSSSVKVDGTSYSKGVYGVSVSKDNGDAFGNWDVEDVNGLAGEEVKVVTDLNGDMITLVGTANESSDEMYGIVTYAKKDRNATVAIYTKDGEKDYNFADKADMPAQLLADVLTDPTIPYHVSTNPYRAVNYDVDYYVAEFTLDTDGDIDTFSIKDITDKKVMKKDSKKDFFYLTNSPSDEKYYFGNGTVFMKATKVKASHPDVVSPKTLDNEDITASKLVAGDTVNAIVFGVDGKDADLVVFTGTTFSGATEDAYYGVVTGTSEYDGDDYIVKLNSIENGTDHEVIVAKGDRAQLTKGSLVEYTLTSSDVMDITNVVTMGNVVADTASVKAGLVSNVSSKYITLTDDGTFRLASDYLIYSAKLDSDDDFVYNDESRLSKLDEGDAAAIILNEDKDVVLVLVFDAKDNAEFAGKLQANMAAAELAAEKAKYDTTAVVLASAVAVGTDITDEIINLVANAEVDESVEVKVTASANASITVADGVAKKTAATTATDDVTVTLNLYGETTTFTVSVEIQ